MWSSNISTFQIPRVTFNTNRVKDLKIHLFLIVVTFYVSNNVRPSAVFPVAWASEEPGDGAAAVVAVVGRLGAPHNEAGRPRRKRTYPRRIQSFNPYFINTGTALLPGCYWY